MPAHLALYSSATDLEQSAVQMSLFAPFGLVLVTQRIYNYFFFPPQKGSQKRHFLTKEVVLLCAVNKDILNGWRRNFLLFRHALYTLCRQQLSNC